MHVGLERQRGPDTVQDFEHAGLFAQCLLGVTLRRPIANDLDEAHVLPARIHDRAHLADGPERRAVLADTPAFLAAAASFPRRVAHLSGEPAERLVFRSEEAVEATAAHLFFLPTEQARGAGVPRHRATLRVDADDCRVDRAVDDLPPLRGRQLTGAVSVFGGHSTRPVHAFNVFCICSDAAATKLTILAVRTRTPCKRTPTVFVGQAARRKSSSLARRRAERDRGRAARRRRRALQARRRGGAVRCRDAAEAAAGDAGRRKKQIGGRRFGSLALQPASPAPRTAAVTTISIRHSGFANDACTVARGGAFPTGAQASQT